MRFLAILLLISAIGLWVQTYRLVQQRRRIKQDAEQLRRLYSVLENQHREVMEIRANLRIANQMLNDVAATVAEKQRPLSPGLGLDQLRLQPD
jgi:hypothetical protein